MQADQTIIDDRPLEILRALEESSGRPLVAKIKALFETESARKIKEIRAAVGDQVTVARLAHGLKSSAANLGAVRVHDLAEQVERNAVEESRLGEWIDKIEFEIGVAIQELKRR